MDRDTLYDHIRKKYNLDQDLADAQNVQADMQLADDMTRAGETIGAAFSPSSQVDEGYFQAQEAVNQAPVENTLAQAQAEDADIEREQRDKDIARKERLGSPDSPLSKLWRDKLAETGYEVPNDLSIIDIKAAGLNPFDLSQQQLDNEMAREKLGLQKRRVGTQEKRADLEEQRLDLKKQQESREGGGPNPASTVFSKAAEREQGKAYGQAQAKAIKANEQLELINDSIDAFENYSKNALGGTGPFATGFGLKKYADEDTQNLEAKFRLINIKNMSQVFDGMSKAVDSDAERRAWEATQPSITNDDRVNSEILLGSKALAKKAKLEGEFQKQYVEQYGTLQGYESPVLGKTEAVVTPDGQMEIVSKDQVDEAKKQGYLTIDEYSKKFTQGELDRSKGLDTSRQQVTVSNGDETYKIPIEDLEEAKSDGFERID